MNIFVYFLNSTFVLFICTFLNICLSELQEITPYLNSEIQQAQLELNLTTVKLNPPNSDLDVQLYKQFHETGVIAIPYISGQFSFRIVVIVTCDSDCPAEWTFDNMRYMYESSTYPRIVPSRIFGNLNQPFRSDLVIEGAMTNNSYGPHVSWLTGKYTCKCSTDNAKASEKYFYAFFRSDPKKEFVQDSSTTLRVRPEIEEEWVGLGCTTQTPNRSILLWNAGGNEAYQWKPTVLGENVKRDLSQGFIVAVDRVDKKNYLYRCTSEDSNDFVKTLVIGPWTRGHEHESLPVLTFNRTSKEYKCCLFVYPPIVSFVNCDNLYECSFRRVRRIGRILPGTRCVSIRTEGSIERCCIYSRPRVPGLLRCVHPDELPIYTPSMIVEDDRSISQNPKIILDIENDEELSLRCLASSFTFSNYLHWELQLWNGSTLSIQNGGSSDYIFQNFTQDVKSGTITSTIQISKEIEIEKASCFAPLIGSTEWRNDTMEFVQELGSLGDTDQGIIITGSMSALILCILVVLVIALKFSRKKRKVLTNEDIQKFLVGGTASKSKDDTDTELTASANELPDSTDIYEDILRLPYNKEYEFPRNSFDYDKKSKKLGEGAFGVVYSGKLRVSENEEFNVAIKMIITNVTREKLKSILAEIKIMSYIGSHVNVVNLLGANTRQLHQNKVLMAVELCGGGSLEDFITKNKTEFNRQAVHGYDLQVPHFSTRILVKWAGEIAHGMIFLSSKKVIHVDLATRNIFLTDTLIPKIGDFGLSRRLYTKEIYLKKSQEYLPIYWMSLESLTNLTFSTQSDVWSFGVTLWEMFALCCEPYKTAGELQKPTWDQMVLFLSSGRRLLQPEHASPSVYVIMQQCWEENPSSRPSFQVLRETFLNELNKLDTHSVLT